MVSQMNPWEYFYIYLINMITPIMLIGTLAIGLGIVIYMFKRFIK